MHTPVQLFAVASLLALHLPSVCGRGLNPTPTQFARLGTLPASSTTPADQQQAAKALVLRVMGAALAPAFSISVVSEDPLENENDAKGWNEYSTGPSNTIALRGTSGVEVATDFPLQQSEFLLCVHFVCYLSLCIVADAHDENDRLPQP